MVMPWLSFLAAWGQHDSRDKIQHVMDRASSAVTQLVFGRWNKIFGEDTRGKEIVISSETLEGERVCLSAFRGRKHVLLEFGSIT